MKKVFSILVVAVAVLVALAGFGVAFAQEPGDGVVNCPMHGGLRGFDGSGRSDGLMHDEMIAAMAERLDLSAADVEARLEAGETVWAIARAEGLSDAEIVTLMQEARQEALDAAVASGDLTQAQADWMAQRMGTRGRGASGRQGVRMGRNGGGFGMDQGMGMRGGWGR